MKVALAALIIGSVVCSSLHVSCQEDEYPPGVVREIKYKHVDPAYYNNFFNPYLSTVVIDTPSSGRIECAQMALSANESYGFAVNSEQNCKIFVLDYYDGTAVSIASLTGYEAYVDFITDTSDCDGNYMYVTKRCYNYHPEIPVPNYWAGALVTCQPEGAGIAEFHTYDEFIRVTRFLHFAKATLWPAVTYIYVGATDGDTIPTHNVWQWLSDGTVMDFPTDILWKLNQPNGPWTDDQNCLVMQEDPRDGDYYGVRLNDGFCIGATGGEHPRVLCEKFPWM